MSRISQDVTDTTTRRLDHHDRTRLLSEVAHGGTSALLCVIRRAHEGRDAAAGHISMSALLRAVPGMGAVTVHELIASVGVHESQEVREVAPHQIAGLLRALGRE
ncbi:hypothetical protein [Streptomyces montanisoli]|uniref:Integration host factor-like helix-two turn-helix domain-containing protein n=1 Tax=Streptomyces montanisoli TaxID=2798581 RepID=A0A940M8Z2_9ACTN|nr:hypothetical protein [Streptomyces montanisoli]MBP0456553.1 hypothetical protein [Streptomyces montanisoli]